MHSIINYNTVCADDLDYHQIGEFYLRYIAGKIGNEIIYIKQDHNYYYYRFKHKNRTLSEIKDISLDELMRMGMAFYPRIKNKDLGLILLAASE